MNIKVQNPSTLTVTFTKDQLPLTFKIFSGKGKLYHFRILQNKLKLIHVNIPHAGNYTYNFGTIVKIEPIQIKPLTFELPPYERNREKPFKIVYNAELNKGTTPARHYTETGIIEVGDFFYSLSEHIQHFILLHEYAHFFYKTEEYCDQWAAKKFIAEGYNNSTAFYALTTVLKESTKNANRILSLQSKLNKNG